MAKISNDNMKIALRAAAPLCYEDDLAVFMSDEAEQMQVGDRTTIRFMKRLHRENSREIRNRIMSVLKVAAMFLLVTGTVLFTLAMSIDTVRAAIKEAIVEMFYYEDFIEVKTKDDSCGTYVERSYELTYIPEGYVLKDELRDHTGIAVSQYYENSDGSSFTFDVSTANGGEGKRFDNTNVKITQITLNDATEATIFEYDYGYKRIMWIEKYCFIVGGYSDLETLIRIAESVQ